VAVDAEENEEQPQILPFRVRMTEHGRSKWVDYSESVFLRKHPSGAKAHIQLARFLARLKSCPCYKTDDGRVTADWEVKKSNRRCFDSPALRST
jgi:hypothetical protein